jgi:hypothetical protein
MGGLTMRTNYQKVIRELLEGALRLESKENDIYFCQLCDSTNKVRKVTAHQERGHEFVVNICTDCMEKY